MKTTKIYLVVCLTFLLTQFNAFAQYNGGNSNGATANQLSLTSCSIPPHFYAYFGGVNDGSGVEELSTTSCGTAAFQFAYMGGIADGSATEEASFTACGIPPSFFAYFGGNNDGANVETLEATVCGFPPQFYAYFGGQGDGFTIDRTAPICPTQPPVADFTASATSICVGQSVTFTDTSTNIPSAWTWTFTGGTPNSSIVQNPVITYNTAGSYAVTLVAANFNGTDTKTVTSYITVTAYPTIVSTTPASRCGSGTVTLGATASAGTLSWYANPTGGTALGTGASFTTPSITATTPYYVETVNGVCSSARTLVNATINAIPIITSTTSGSRCGTGSVALSATADTGNLEWFANATGGSPIAFGSSFGTPNTLSTTRDYYVEAVNGSCRSGRTAVTATINPAATITATTAGFACDSGPVTLGATTGAGTLNWYNVATGGTILGTGASFTTPNLTVSATYYVEAINGTCTSARTAVVASVFPTPLVTSVTQVTPICISGSTTLTATSNYNGTNTWAWYDAPTGGTLLSTSINYVTPVITVNTTYYVATDRFGCTSPRTAITATVTQTPTIVSTTPGSRCGTGSVSLSATASAGAISWWTAASGGTVLASTATFNTPAISATTTYYVQTTDNTCVSARTAVIATIVPTPTITTTTPASICGSGTVTLGATASAGTLNWYAVSTGGTSLGTGASFTTPTITAPTIYYVDATAGTCTSPRTAVTATVNVIPFVNTTNSGISRCDSGSLSLVATASANALVAWYANPTGGSILSTNNNFVTPSISITTTYYVEATRAGCVSATRTPVIATIINSPTITTTSPNSRCGTGSVSLSATSSAGAISWWTAASGGTVLANTATFNTPAISATTTYYVQTTDNTCVSTRTAVIATIDTAQTITSTTPASRCDAGTVTLSAAATGGTLNWYANASGGSVLGTGSNFTTPSISSSTNYYVEVTNGTCTSARIAVLASITPVNAPTGNANQTFCNTETVGLLVTTAGSNIVWYTAATGGTIVPNGTQLVSGTTYYASQNNGTCESPTRLAVTATLGACLGTEEFEINLIKLYPNPVIDFVTISSTEAMTKIEVVNMLGQMVYSTAVNDIETNLDMTRYATGTYIIRVSVDNKIKIFKVIKK